MLLSIFYSTDTFAQTVGPSGMYDIMYNAGASLSAGKCGDTKKCNDKTHKCIELKYTQILGTFQEEFAQDDLGTYSSTVYECVSKTEDTGAACERLIKQENGKAEAKAQEGWSGFLRRDRNFEEGTMQDAMTSCQEVEIGTVHHNNHQDVNVSSRVTKGCLPLQQKLEQNQRCPLCPLFKVILNTDQTMASHAYSALAKSFRNVIIMVLALFIAYKTLISVSAMTKQDVGKYLGEITVQSFKVLVAALLLSNPDYIYHYVVNPLIKAGLEFGLSMFFDNATTLMKEARESDLFGIYGDFRSGVISKDVLSDVLSTVILFSKEAATLPSIGGTLICVSVNEASPALHLPHIPMFIEGLLCLGFGWAIAFACCFYLLDSAVRFGIFCTLLPFLIASWPFKVTLNYTKQGWDIFINVIFNFIMMGLIICLSLQLILQALMGDSQIDLSQARSPEELELLKHMAELNPQDQLTAALNGNNVEVVKQLLDLSGIKFLILVACCIFAFKLVGQVNDLAQNISGTSGGENIGGKLGGLAAQGIERGAGMAKNAAIGRKGDDGHRHGGLLSGVANGLHDRKERFQNRVAAHVAGANRRNPNNGNQNQNQNQDQNQQQPDNTANDSSTQNYDEDTSSWD